MSATGATNWISTSGATFYITGVQLEKGSNATSFDLQERTTELLACQRYLPCFDATSGGSSLNKMGMTYSTNNNVIVFEFLVPARVRPTNIFNTANSTFTMYNGINVVYNPTNITFNSSSINDATILTTHTTGFTVAQPCRLQGVGAKILFWGVNYDI